MKRHYWIITLCLAMACTNGKSEKDVIPKEKMTAILWDMIQVDELATLRLTRDTGRNAKKERMELYQKVFQLHKISRDQFSKSFTYYSVHPELIKGLFDSLEARGTRERKNTFLPKDSLK
jgi:hypothetical protein